MTLDLSGSAPAAGVAFQLPVFVRNVASAGGATINQQTGTVLLPTGDMTVTVQLVHPRAQEAPRAR